MNNTLSELISDGKTFSVGELENAVEDLEELENIHFVMRGTDYDISGFEKGDVLRVVGIYSRCWLKFENFNQLNDGTPEIKAVKHTIRLKVHDYRKEIN